MEEAMKSKFVLVVLVGLVAASISSLTARAQTDRKVINQPQSGSISTEKRVLKSMDSSPRGLPPSPCRDDRCNSSNKYLRSATGDSRALNPQPIPPGKIQALNPQPIPPGKPQALNPQPIPPGKLPPHSNEHAKKKKKKIYME
jgi:hypothetical protein